MANDLPVRWLPPAAPAPAAPEPAPGPPKTAWKRALGPLAALGVLALNYGAKLKVLLLLLPKIKLFTTGASMLVSIAAYAFVFGWPFAVGFVLLLLVHEMGHVWQLRREGIEASAPLFIPFLGAAIAARSLGDDAAAEARVGLAGPVVGTAGAAAVAVAGATTGSELLQALAFTGFFLNLFNLVPVVPFDGGRAMAALAPWMWFVGFGGLVALMLISPNPFLLIIVLLGGVETWRRWKARRSGLQTGYYRVRPAHRAMVLGVYLALIAACAVGMDLTFIERDFGDA